MRLPARLEQAIEVLAESVPGTELGRAARELSDAYLKADFSAPALRRPEHRIAYLVTRMPATYAVCRFVLNEAKLRIPYLSPKTILDLGAGPGTATFAALQLFGAPDSATLVERDGAMIASGCGIANSAFPETSDRVRWVQRDLSPEVIHESDLIVFSYSLGELSRKAALEMVRSAWNGARQALVCIEPGTPKGFGLIHEIRTRLLEWGATMAAPCPHDKVCPMAAAGDWCHFAERIERTSLHRRLKGGTLGHEDEKFSYVVASKLPVQRPESRILRHPMRHAGYTELLLCEDGQLQRDTVTRSQKERWRAVKKSEWGDGWERNRLNGE